jgi:hypothetical protein
VTQVTVRAYRSTPSNVLLVIVSHEQNCKYPDHTSDITETFLCFRVSNIQRILATTCSHPGACLQLEAQEHVAANSSVRQSGELTSCELHCSILHSADGITGRHVHISDAQCNTKTITVSTWQVPQIYITGNTSAAHSVWCQERKTRQQKHHGTGHVSHRRR